MREERVGLKKNKKVLSHGISDIYMSREYLLVSKTGIELLSDHWTKVSEWDICRW